MILGFKTYINGLSTFFMEKILAGTNFDKPALSILFTPKIHTIRKGNRFKAGSKLHMAIHVRTKMYNQFNKDIPELQHCVSTQEIKICWVGSPGHWRDHINVFIDNVHIDNGDTLELLAINDGFKNADAFFAWFNKDFEGQIIHWTDFKY